MAARPRAAMPPLADYLPYLLNRAGARLAEGFSAEARALGVTLPEWRVLAVLRERPGRPMGDLAEATSIEGSTLTRVVDRLARRGLVQRTVAAQDKRVVTLDPTAEGRALTVRLLPLALRYEARALKGFTEAEAATLKTLLRRVYANPT
jgi:DNA-binding MarR family transcriptional regulator